MLHDPVAIGSNAGVITNETDVWVYAVLTAKGYVTCSLPAGDGIDAILDGGAIRRRRTQYAQR